MNCGMIGSIVSNVLLDGFMWKFIHEKWYAYCELIIKEYWCIYWAIFVWYYIFRIIFTHPLCTCLFGLDCGNWDKIEILIFRIEIFTVHDYCRGHFWWVYMIEKLIFRIEISTGREFSYWLAEVCFGEYTVLMRPR